jgi:hypothetical protein
MDTDCIVLVYARALSLARYIATLGIEERLISEESLSGLIKTDLTNHPPANPPTHIDIDCYSATTDQIIAKF